MGVPIEFQYVLNNSTEILISFIIISVSVYYLFSKGKTSSQQHQHTQFTLYQQASSETRHSTSKLNATPGQSCTASQSTTFSDTSSFGIPEDLALVSQACKVSSMVEKNNSCLYVKKSSHMAQKVTAPDATDISLLVARGNNWFETEKLVKTTADLDVNTLHDNNNITTTATANSVMMTKKTIVEDVGSNRNIDVSQPTNTALKNAAHTENRQKHRIENTNRYDERNENEKHYTRNTVDPFQANNDDDECATQVEPLEQQINWADASHTELSNQLRGMDGNKDMEYKFENSPLKTCNNESAISLNQQKKTPLSNKTHENQASNTISAKNGPTTLSTKRNKHHAKTGNSTTDHSTPVYPPPNADSKPKQDMSRLERIGQQRQPYVALYKSRCEFWPGCTNNHCKYYHPFTDCRNGNACKFGNKCVFLHPKDYLDHRSLKPTDQGKNKSKWKSKTNIKTTSDKVQGNRDKPSKKAVE